MRFDSRHPSQAGGRRGALVLAAALLTAGCAQAGPDATPTGQPATDPTPVTSAPSAPASPTASRTPGHATEVAFAADATLSVVGLDHEDLLAVREGPGASYHVVASLGPLADAVTTGRGWTPHWIELAVDGVTGWVEIGNVAGRGGTDDITAQVIRRLGQRPTADSMAVLGRTVAEAMASVEPRSSITMSVAPTVGDLGEVTFDVVGLGDDSIWAERHHVFGQPTGDGRFSLGSVETTSLCSRGVPDGDLCP